MCIEVSSRFMFFPGYRNRNRGRAGGIDDLEVLGSGLMSCLLYHTYTLHLIIVLFVSSSYVFVTDSHRVTGSDGNGREALDWE